MSAHRTGWSARQLGVMLGIPGRTIARWAKDELITPESCGRGRGGHTIGSMGLLEACTVISLRQANFSLQSIRKAIAQLRKQSGSSRPLATLTLAVSGRDILWLPNGTDGLQISALRRPGQPLLVFPIGEQHKYYEDQLNKLGYTHDPDDPARQPISDEELVSA